MTALRPLPLLALLLPLLAGCDAAAPPDRFQGYVEGEYLRIAAPEAGWLETVTVRRGERIAAGAPLFTLDASRERAAVAEAEARLAQAEAQLADLLTGKRPEEVAVIAAQLQEARAVADLARLELDRSERLAKTDVMSAARLDTTRAARQEALARVAAMEAQLATARLPAREEAIAAARAAVAAAEANLDQARWRLSQRQVAAPAAGLVEDRVRDPGEWVPANGVVVSLLPPEQVKLVFFVPEPRRSAFQPGQTVAVACTGCPDGLTARVTFVAPEAEYTPPVIYSADTRAKLVFRAEAEPAGDAATLLPGQPVDIRLTAGGGAP